MVFKKSYAISAKVIYKIFADIVHIWFCLYFQFSIFIFLLTVRKMKTMMMKLKEQEIKQSNEIITKNNAKTKKE